MASSRVPDSSKTELNSRAESVETHNNINAMEHNVSTADGRVSLIEVVLLVKNDPK